MFAEAYCYRGLAKNRLGLYKEAIEDLNRAIFNDSQYDKAYHNRGIANMNLGQYKAALKDFEQALVFNPKLDEARKHRADVKELIED